jgi:hypothetical protein
MKQKKARHINKQSTFIYTFNFGFWQTGFQISHLIKVVTLGEGWTTSLN